MECLEYTIIVSAYNQMLDAMLPPDGFIYYANMVNSDCYGWALTVVHLLTEAGIFTVV